MLPSSTKSPWLALFVRITQCCRQPRSSATPPTGRWENAAHHAHDISFHRWWRGFVAAVVERGLTRGWKSWLTEVQCTTEFAVGHCNPFVAGHVVELRDIFRQAHVKLVLSGPCWLFGDLILHAKKLQPPLLAPFALLPFFALLSCGSVSCCSSLTHS